MPRNYINSIVFVGREFDVSLFDEKELAPLLGPLDKNSVKAGPIGNFSYSNGHYNFQITPDRIDVRHSGTTILPDAPIQASVKVIERLRPISGLVTAVGINCDTFFSDEEIGKSGREFCQALIDNAQFQFLYEGCSDAAPLSISTIFKGHPSGMQNTVRIEPKLHSEQQNLMVSFNGHQNVKAGDNLNEKLDAVGEVKKNVERIHRKIIESSGVSHESRNDS